MFPKHPILLDPARVSSITSPTLTRPVQCAADPASPSSLFSLCRDPQKPGTVSPTIFFLLHNPSGMALCGWRFHNFDRAMFALKEWNSRISKPSDPTSAIIRDIVQQRSLWKKEDETPYPLQQQWQGIVDSFLDDLRAAFTRRYGNLHYVITGETSARNLEYADEDWLTNVYFPRPFLPVIIGRRRSIPCYQDQLRGLYVPFKEM